LEVGEVREAYQTTMRSGRKCGWIKNKIICNVES
jgi:hypothetical protein